METVDVLDGALVKVGVNEITGVLEILEEDETVVDAVDVLETNDERVSEEVADIVLDWIALKLIVLVTLPVAVWRLLAVSNELNEFDAVPEWVNVLGALCVPSIVKVDDSVLVINDVRLIVLVIVPVILAVVVAVPDGSLEFVDVFEMSGVPVSVLEIGGVFEPAIVPLCLDEAVDVFVGNLVNVPVRVASIV